MWLAWLGNSDWESGEKVRLTKTRVGSLNSVTACIALLFGKRSFPNKWLKYVVSVSRQKITSKFFCTSGLPRGGYHCTITKIRISKWMMFNWICSLFSHCGRGGVLAPQRECGVLQGLPVGARGHAHHEAHGGPRHGQLDRDLPPQFLTRINILCLSHIPEKKISSWTCFYQSLIMHFWYHITVDIS